MTSDGRQSEQVDITPHPRILRMLGEIAFEPHKCIGELVDNAIDGFLRDTKFLSENPRHIPEITITVPHRDQIEAGRGEIVVADNGPGMTLADLTDAARAGYSGSSPIENLGLFGLGFNIATARLGGITELRSGVRGDTAWSVLDIDLTALQSQGGYVIRPRFENKPSNRCGTRVTIRTLKREQAVQIAGGVRGASRRSVSGLRSWIGRTYTRYLREAEARLGNKSLRIVVNGEPATPYRWCVWGSSRYVELGAAARGGTPERLVAYNEFDQLLGVGLFCPNCLSWQPAGTPDGSPCVYCRETTVAERSRRMRGWIGVQRHMDDEEYGFDFLRNGRAILQWDKRVFSWTDPDTGRVELEYPIDEPRARHGRILGEIEIDHVPIHYQKDSFEEQSWLWTEVIDNLRGRSPLRPQIAERRHLPRNESLLQPAYRGYHRTRTEEGGRLGGSIRSRREPWSRDLIISQDTARAYYARFLDGDPDYQTDDKWYEWMVDADAQIARRESQTETSSDGEELPPIISPAASPIAVQRTERERLRESGEVDEVLSMTYGFEPARVLEVTVHRVTQNLFREQGAIRHAVPILVMPELHGAVDIFYDETHPRIVHEEADVQSLVLAEVALLLRDRFYDRLPVSFVLDHLRKATLPELTRANLTRNAWRLIDSIWPRYVYAFNSYEEGDQISIQSLVEEEDRRQLGRAVAQQGGGQEGVDGILDSGEFLRWMPHLMSRILRRYPERFLDNRLFAIAYRNLPQGLDDSERSGLGWDNVSRVANPLEDVANVTRSSRFDRPEIERIVRLRAFRSIDLVQEYLVQT